ncbi:hypothetical protein GUJ93_ZPchr0048g33358 [Zizania palustris]|uniref:Uncharacterized protein n=1 Tax=Zizania palustris TaxID=103762 RepID=A0A8J5V024_ZIZPA|nr:hypothetical protein GUJ93_ZPchr0048g33358 [Zizania palustris]
MEEQPLARREVVLGRNVHTTSFAVKEPEVDDDETARGRPPWPASLRSTAAPSSSAPSTTSIGYCSRCSKQIRCSFTHGDPGCQMSRRMGTAATLSHPTT